MAYEVTATRKRPRTFDELAGQEFVVATLKSSLRSGRIAHAYLFSGPRGVGKTSAARILAKALNCEQGPTPEPCGTCAACTEVAQGNSLDVIEIDGASNTSVNDVREIKDEVLFSPNNSRYKVYIIDEVHMLSNSAFNALLKTIEEPPPYIVFVFATTEIHKVPATIRSRCQQFNFRMITPDLIKERLAAAAEELGIEAEDEALFWIAKEATGSLRDAYTLFDQVVSFSNGRIESSLIREKLGLAGLDKLNAIGDALAGGDRAAALQEADEVLARGVAVEQFVVDLAEYFRNLLLLASGVRKESILGYPPDRFSARVLEAFDTGRLERASGLLFDLHRDIRYSLSPRFELDLTLSRLASLASFISREDLLGQIRQVRDQLLSCPPAPETGTPSLPSTAAECADESETEDAEDTENGRNGAASDSAEETNGHAFGDGILPAETVDAILKGLRRKKLALSSALEKALSWTVAEGTLSIVFDSPFSANFVKQDQAPLGERIRELSGQDLKILLEVERSGESVSGPAERKDEQVEMVRKMFRGEIVKE